MLLLCTKHDKQACDQYTFICMLNELCRNAYMEMLIIKMLMILEHSFESHKLLCLLFLHVYILIYCYLFQVFIANSLSFISECSDWHLDEGTLEDVHLIISSRLIKWRLTYSLCFQLWDYIFVYLVMIFSPCRVWLTAWSLMTNMVLLNF